MNVDELKKAIYEIRHYGVAQLRALALLAREIRQIDDANIRAELIRDYEATHGRRVSVWARIPYRFPEYFSGETQISVDGFLALALMCQLPKRECRELYNAHREHLDEPLVHLLVRDEVNELRPRRERIRRDAWEKLVDLCVKLVHSTSSDERDQIIELISRHKLVAARMEEKC